MVVGAVGASVVVSVSASVVVSCVVPLFSVATGVVLSAPAESLSAQELSKHRKRLIHKMILIVLFTLITPLGYYSNPPFTVYPNWLIITIVFIKKYKF